MKSAIIASVLIVFTTPIAASWSSGGGGESHQDGRNPWFLQNVETVRYCIDVDRRSFDLSASELNEMVLSAVEFWRRQLSYAFPGQFRLLTQRFVRERCSRATDLAIQFGVLSRSQRRMLGDPREYIGIAVRTSYDRVRLRGRGFVYISPDNGRWRFKGFNLVNGAWELGDHGLLQRTIIHELGHVLGLGHFGDHDASMMSRYHLTYIMHQSRAPRYSGLAVDRDGPFFREGGGIFFPQTREFWGMPDGDRQLWVDLSSWEQGYVGFKSAPLMPNADFEEVGRFNISVKNTKVVRGSQIRVALNPLQEVFNSNPSSDAFVNGPAFFDLELDGYYQVSGSEKRHQMIITQKSDFYGRGRLAVDGIRDGRWLEGIVFY